MNIVCWGQRVKARSSLEVLEGLCGTRGGSDRGGGNGGARGDALEVKDVPVEQIETAG